MALIRLLVDRDGPYVWWEGVLHICIQAVVLRLTLKQIVYLQLNKNQPAGTALLQAVVSG